MCKPNRIVVARQEDKALYLSLLHTAKRLSKTIEQITFDPERLELDDEDEDYLDPEYTDSDLDEDIDADHLPGKHDQKTHGRRSAPSQDKLNKSELNKFGSSLNRTYKTTIDGKDYFVKKSNSEGQTVDQTVGELMGFQAAKDLGIKDNVIPVTKMTHNGEECIVSPWTDGRPLAELSFDEKRKIMGKLSDEEFTKLHAFEYIVSDDDRHEGNYLYDESTKQLKMIDLEFAMYGESSFYSPHSNTTSQIADWRAVAHGGGVGSLRLDQNTLKSVLSRKDKIIKNADKAGLSGKRMDALKRRFSVLEEMSTDPKPTLARMQDVSLKYEK